MVKVPHTIRDLGPSRRWRTISQPKGSQQDGKATPIPTRPMCTVKVEKQPLLPIEPTRPMDLIFSLSQGVLSHIFLSSLYK